MMRLYVCHAPALWFRPDGGREAVKIGVSANPFRRKWGLRLDGCDRPLLLWQSPPFPPSDAFRIEAELKRRFVRRCVSGTEWFSIKPETAIRAARAIISTPDRLEAARAVWFDHNISSADAAERTGIATRTLHRHFGKRGSPAFGAALNRRRGK